MDSWELAKSELEEGAKLMQSALGRLSHHFDGSRNIWIRLADRNPLDYEAQTKHLEHMIWNAFVDRTEIKKIMSMKAIAELDKQLSERKHLPPLTYENLCAMLNNVHDNTAQFLAEKVREVYDWLRPDHGWRAEYKTNKKSAAVGLGPKVVLTWAVSRWSSTYSPQSNTENHLRALDQVFHMLAGKPFGNTHWGPLYAEICKRTPSDNSGETDFFRFKCFKNHNLHLEFKDSELLGRFNVIAGGNRLQSQEEKAAA